MKSIGFILHVLEASPSNKKRLIKSASRQEIRFICEVILNYISSSKKVDKDTVQHFNKYKYKINILLSKAVSTNVKKEVLSNLKLLHILLGVISTFLKNAKYYKIYFNSL